jgi:hypothetical protein
VQLENLSTDITLTGRVGKDNQTLTEDMLKAAKHTVPRGTAKDYTSFWTPELDALLNERNNCRANVETDNSDENNRKLGEAQATLTEKSKKQRNPSSETSSKRWTTEKMR